MHVQKEPVINLSVVCQVMSIELAFVVEFSAVAGTNSERDNAEQGRKRCREQCEEGIHHSGKDELQWKHSEEGSNCPLWPDILSCSLSIRVSTALVFPLQCE